MPQKSGNQILWIVLAVVAVCGCAGVAVLAAILFPVFEQAKIAALRTTSLSNLKQLGTGTMMYSIDYDDRLPLGPEWMDAVLPYVKSEERYHAPRQGQPQAREYGYAFREELGGKDTRKVVDPNKFVMYFDSTLPGRSAVGGLATFPRPGRYGGKNTMVMVDCSAKAINPADGYPMSEIK